MTIRVAGVLCRTLGRRASARRSLTNRKARGGLGGIAHQAGVVRRRRFSRQAHPVHGTTVACRDTCVGLDVAQLEIVAEVLSSTARLLFLDARGYSVARDPVLAHALCASTVASAASIVDRAK